MQHASFPSVVTPITVAVHQSKVKLRPYQLQLESDIYNSWNQGNDNVLAVLPTGGGKTVTLARIVAQHLGGSCVIAHRQELVGQISLALNKEGVRHRIVAPPPVRKLIIAKHMEEHGVTFYDPQSKTGVAGVDSLVKIDKGKAAQEYGAWRQQVSLWVQDEAHHVQRSNKWGKAAALFYRPAPDRTLGLGVTASPKRADGRGLGRESGDGLFDDMVFGPSMRDLINDGYLTPYRIATVPCRVDYEKIDVGESGELVQAQLVAAEDNADELVGDIVEQYLKHAPGKRGVTFVSSVNRARLVAKAYCDAGVPALALDGTTPDDERDAAIRKLRTGEVLQLVNCDLFGEGFDLPAIEVVSMATATASLARYMQWFGRVLRLMLESAEWDGYDELSSEGRRARIAASRKPFGIIIDHGANLLRHKGPPDISRPWSLDKAGKRGSAPSEPLPYMICRNPGYRLTAPPPAGPTFQEFRQLGWTIPQMIGHGHLVDTQEPCVEPYPRTERSCPWCGFVPEPVSRTEPEHVDGDLELLDPEALRLLWEPAVGVERTDGEQRHHAADNNVPPAYIQANVNAHAARREAVQRLKVSMGYWGYWWKEKGDSDHQLQRRFWHSFGVDVATAQGLSRDDAEKLETRIRQSMLLDGAVIPG